MIPNYLSTVWAVNASVLGNHLWQSTLFTVVAGLLTLALRKNPARTRYWIWLAASVKFLIPFSLLFGVGSHMARSRGLTKVQPRVLFAMSEVSQPFIQPTMSTIARTGPPAHLGFFHLLPAILLAAWLCGFIVVLSLWCVRWRRISASLLAAVPLREGREVEALRRLERIGGIRRRIKLLLSPASVEPGIFGIARPILVWPENISKRLADAQLEAILAHEICHVRRHDNLTAAIHMTVEAVFWFHPLVWWLGMRLVEERELACDEAVLQLCKQPHIYAESILKVCEFCVESPLTCVSGVTGSDLKKRIVRIMSERVALKLDFGKKVLLISIGLMAIAVPILLGQANTTHDGAVLQKDNENVKLPVFDVVSIRPNKSVSGGMRISFQDESFTAANLTLRNFLINSYDVKEDLISGLPDWARSAHFDIDAKVVNPDMDQMEKLTREQRRQMLLKVLQDRFHLQAHLETKILPVYELIVAKGGPKFTGDGAAAADIHAAAAKSGFTAGGMLVNDGELVGHIMPVSSLAYSLSGEVGRTVIDKTGLTGNYDFELKWTPEAEAGTSVDNGQTGPQSTASSIFTAVQEQLGLKLQPAKGPVETLVVDHVEKPSPN